MNLLDIFEGREPYQQAIDRLETRRIEDLEAKMDDCARRGDKEGFQKCKAERDSYHRVKMDEGSMKQWLWNEAERMDRDAFVANAGEYGMTAEEAAEWWDDINGVDEAAIGQDIVNKSEKMARATPPTRAGAVASTVKNAAKWLAGKGGPGREGPTYEGADDIADRGEYDREGDMAKDNIHTIVRNARELESVIGDDDNLPEWVQDKLANIKGMMTAVSEYMQTQHEREGVVPEGTETQWSKESDWKTIPKAKSGKPVDPRGEVTRLSDVARREAERKANQKKSSEEVEEGWSDKVNPVPYGVYINGRQWKEFPTDDHARAVADKLTAKLKAEGSDKKVTIAPSESYMKKLGEEQQPGMEEGKKKKSKKKSSRSMQGYFFPGYAYYGSGNSGEDSGGGGGDGGGGGGESINHESSYPGNIGMMELAKFFSTADEEQKTLFNQLLEKGKKGLAWKLVQDIVGVKLQGKEFAEGGNPAQQAAIAIAMKKSGDKPKSVDEGARGDAIKQGYQAAVKGLTKQQNPYYKSVNGQTPPEAYDWEAGWEDARDSGKIPQGVAEAIPVIRGTQPTGAQYANQLAKIAMKLAKQRHADGLRADAKDFNKAAKLFAAGDVDGGAEIIAYKMDTEPADEFYTYMEHYKIPTEIVFGLDEETTRLDPKCWTGKKIGNPKTKVKGGVRVNNCVPATEDIYMEDEPSPVESAIIRRIMVSHVDWLQKFGPEKVMQAAEEVAYNVGDVDEIGTSDVSAYVHEVGQILGA